ncbi:hypothetical protein K438DRAFT_1753635 [Mycena galopus ATCC 62051]|nr:hypothetical protein K438DRAFT_1753635 [Mycena galopus ATCC 62051]
MTFVEFARCRHLYILASHSLTYSNNPRLEEALQNGNARRIGNRVRAIFVTSSLRLIFRKILSHCEYVVRDRHASAALIHPITLDAPPFERASLSRFRGTVWDSDTVEGPAAVTDVGLLSMEADGKEIFIPDSLCSTKAAVTDGSIMLEYINVADVAIRRGENRAGLLDPQPFITEEHQEKICGSQFTGPLYVAWIAARNATE